VLVKRILEWGADIVAEKAKQNLAKAARTGTGQAAQGIWAGRAKGRVNMSVETGWSHRYPSVLEWGPETATAGWEIKPRVAKLLRFPIRGKGGNVEKVVYAKRVWHPWDDSQRRPHFEEAVNTVWPQVIAKLPQALKEAIE
jgi:hypothetical protein